jgi:trk system potassium uptake protein TrkH
MKAPVLPGILLILLGMVAVVMLIPLALAVILSESGMVMAIGVPAGIVIAVALPVFFSLRKNLSRISSRDGFLLVFLAWVFMSLLGAMPFYLSTDAAGAGISFTDAFFESACGFTTTGATTIADVEALPKSLLLWRSMSHWIGGMGIVLLTVALMPLLGVGGFQMIKAEAPGADQERFTPRIADTARILWLTYCVLTALLFLLFKLGGMDVLDAACHSLTTMASGGVSVRNQGIASYNSVFIETVSMVFMLLAGLNFNIYHRLAKGNFTEAADNTEGRAYLLIFFVAAAALAISLIPHYGSAGSALRYGAFQAASILSTTGQTAADYTAWPAFSQAVVFCLMFVGGCSASTAGGIKVIRHVVLWKQSGSEMRRILYPQGVFSIHLNKKVGRKDVVYSVTSFVFLYAAVVFLVSLAGSLSGLDVFSAFNAAVATVSNLGTGFGAVGPGHNFGQFPDHLKWIYAFAMIAGRLELWTVLTLLSPEYWRR